MILPIFRYLSKSFNKRSFHSTKCSLLFYESPDKDGLAKKSKEEEEWEKLRYIDKLKQEFGFFKEECGKAYKQLKHRFTHGPPLITREYEVDVIYRFTGKAEELDTWIVSTDSDHNVGYSRADLKFTEEAKGMFSGYLDTKLPRDGQIKFTGVCNLKSESLDMPFKVAKDKFDWNEYTHIVMRVRGDGRTYMLNLHTERQFDVAWYDTYHYFMWTRGGPYWQIIKIPFSRFVFAYKGRVQPNQETFHRDEINSISITLADKITGPFQLEIDWIGVEYDPNHIEEFAYELYYTDTWKTWA